MRIFLSYRRDDASGHAGRLYDLLAGRYGKQQVFMDLDAIPLGSRFGDEIDQAVASCDVLIALMGRGWLAAADAEGGRRLDDPHDYVRREIESALERGVAVVPTCVQGAEIPRPEDLPRSLAPLAERQGFELSDGGWRDDVARLTRRLEGKEEDPPRTRVGRGRLALALGGVALVAVVAAFALTRGGGEDGGARKPTGAADRRLLAMVPATTRPGCNRASSPDPITQSNLSCGAGSTVSVGYFLFSDRATAAAWYRQTLESERVTGTGACTADDFSGEVTYEVAGRPAGRYVCFFDSERDAVLIALDSRAPVAVRSESHHGKGRAAAASTLRLWACCIRIQP